MFALVFATLAALATAAPVAQTEAASIITAVGANFAADAVIKSDVFSTEVASSGEATYYAVGLGACGWTNTDAEYVVAMNAADYSLQSCGQYVSIQNPRTGASQVARVVDLCPGCAKGDLDMSDTLFQALGEELGVGRFPITWSYTGETFTETAPNLNTA